MPRTSHPPQRPSPSSLTLAFEGRATATGAPAKHLPPRTHFSDSTTQARWKPSGGGEGKNRPQTLYRLQDSPVALAAWIIDHDIWTYRQIARVFDGGTEGLTRDDICDNITLYWLTGTGVSSARLYWENKLAFFAPKGVKIPVVVSAFPEEICPIPRKWAEKAYPKLVYYKRHPKGAHFAAWEQPQAIVEDLRAGFKSLR